MYNYAETMLSQNINVLRIIRLVELNFELWKRNKNCLIMQVLWVHQIFFSLYLAYNNCSVPKKLSTGCFIK